MIVRKQVYKEPNSFWVEITNERKIQNQAKKVRRKIEVRYMGEFQKFGRNTYWKQTGQWMKRSEVIKFGDYIPYKERLMAEIQDHYDQEYPSRPPCTLEMIIQQYKSKGRKVSKELIKRSYALIIAHIRHNHTDYDGSLYNLGGFHRDSKYSTIKSHYNNEAHKIARKWSTK